MRPKGKLFALIALFAAVGLITAMGAFTTVEAERTADVQVAGDASALLALQAGGSDLIDGSGDQIQITLDEERGLNLDATTTVDGADFLTVTNNGGNPINLDATYETEGDTQVYFVVSDETTLDAASPESLNGDGEYYSINDNGGINLGTGDSAEIGIVIETGSSLSDGDNIFTGEVVTFNAESTGSSE